MWEPPLERPERTGREPEAPLAETTAAAEPAPTAPSFAPLTETGEPASELPARIPGLPELELDLDQLRAAFDIPIEVNEEVVACVRRLQSAELRPMVLGWLAREQRYGPRLRDILRQEGVPEDLVYVAMVESGFVPHATSRARAVGIWQFMASTGKQYGLRQDRWVDERRDPEKAARAAARFLKDLRQRTGDWYLALAAYNAGPARIARAREETGSESFWDLARSPNLLPRETRAYVPNVLAAALVARFPAAFGFREDEIERLGSIDYETVRVPRATSLSLLAKAARASVKQLRDLNPELRRSNTPPRPYALRIPRGQKAVFAANWPRVVEKARRTVVARHRVKPGETLWSLSRRLGVSVEELARWNGIHAPRRHVLQAGKFLTVKPTTLVLD